MDSEFRSKGAAYWADASQMKIPRLAASAMRLATKLHRMASDLGYTGW